MRIAEYYNELQRREGLEPAELIAEWAQADTDAISAAFRTAVATSRITEQNIPIWAGSTNQSIGNQVADFFVPIINQHLQEYRIDACPGGGYPDKILVEIASRRMFPFELKAQNGGTCDSRGAGCEADSSSGPNQQSGVHKNVELLGRDQPNCGDKYESSSSAPEASVRRSSFGSGVR